MNLVFSSLSLAREKISLVTLRSFSSNYQKLSLNNTLLANSLNSFFLRLYIFLLNLIGFVYNVKASRKFTFSSNPNCE